VLLSLRGADPFLARTLRALLEQTHEDFCLRLIVDSETDPAWNVVEPFLEESNDPRVQVLQLTQRLSTCGLKNSALIQGTAELEEDFDVIVQVDADAVPYPNWLRDLLIPFQDPRVGATGGVRWYAPPDQRCSSGIRYLWGCSAMVQMHQFGMIWGGSMAFRRELLDHAHLRQRWAKSLVDDLEVSNAVTDAGLEIRYVPVVLLNQESIELGDCYRFIRRQTLSVRLSHPSWSAVSGFAVAAGMASFSNALGFFLALAAGDNFTAMVALISGVSYACGFLFLTRRLDSVVRECAINQGGDIEPRRWQHPLVIPGTITLYVACWISSLFMRRIDWRGITYNVADDGSISKVSDTPYATSSPCLSKASVV